MTSLLKVRSLRSICTRSFFRVSFALLLLVSVRNASADYETWTGATSSDWDTVTNWHGYYNAAEVPQNYDIAFFSGQTPNMAVTFSLASNNPGQVYFQNAGYDYTIGSLSSTNGLTFNDYSGIYVQANLQGHGGYEDIEAPLTGNGRLFLANYSPADPEADAVGYNNTLQVDGSITMNTNQALLVYGSGNVDFTGTISGGNNGYGVQTEMMGAATATFSGTSSDTGGFMAGGNVVFDYTTNNTQKFSPTAGFAIGNYGISGNGIDGGHVTIDANQTAATTVTMGSASSTPTFQYDNSQSPPVENGAYYAAIGGTYVRGSDSITVNGSSDSSIPTTVNLGFLNDNQNGSVVDLTGNGNVSFYTNSVNNTQYGAQINILGPYVTYDETYWAQSGGNVYGGTFTATDPATGKTFGTNGSSTPLLINPLINDDGDSFTSQWSNYTVSNGAPGTQVINSAYYAATGQQEGADTIRFTNTGTLDLGAGTTYTNPSNVTYTGTGVLDMVYGGIMVTQGVTGNTSIINGTLANNRDLNGLTIINYSSGTLTIGANLEEIVGSYLAGNDRTDEIGKDGSGTVVFSGDNRSLAPGSTIYVDQGLLVDGSAYGLGTGLQLRLNDPSSKVDLDGQNLAVATLNSSNDNNPGNVAASEGLNSSIENTAAGTISRLTIEGTVQPQYSNNDTNVHTGDLYGDDNLGNYAGGLNEVSGSIISLDVEQGSDTSQVEFILGVADPIGDPINNTSNVSGILGSETEITGAIIVGNHADLGLTGYGNIETMGVADINGVIAPDGQQAANFGTTYLAGTGTMSAGYAGGWGFGVSPVGSATDTFNGHFGTSSQTTQFSLDVGGTGTLAVTNPIYSYGLTAEGTATVITPGVANGANVFADAEGTIKLTGTSGVVTGNVFFNQNGTVDIAPSGSNANVVVTNNGAGTLQLYGNGTLELDSGNNTSLTYELGNTSNGFTFDGYNNFDALTIASAQGLSAFGTTDKLIVLSNGTVNTAWYPGQGFYASNNASSGSGIVSSQFFLQDASVNSTKNATFASYIGTGATTDTGFVPYTYTAAETNNLNNLTSGSVNLINQDYSYTNNQGYNSQVYGLEIDNATLTVVNSPLNISVDNWGNGGLILNGGTIAGNGIQDSRFLSIYTSLADGHISVLNEDYGGQAIAKDGPGTLYISQLNGAGQIQINDGVLDLPSISAPGPVVLDGGVLQSNGSYTFTLAGPSGPGDLELISGGFSARGGALSVTLQDATTSTNLVWGVGGTSDFLGEGDVLAFGSTSTTNPVFLEDNLNLGLPENGNAGQQALYSRVVSVTANTADAGLDPSAYKDYAVIDGQVSATDPFAGLAKTGTGLLYLDAGNTYTGATTIAQGTLGILADSSLGVAPTAAYALNTTPGLTGAALTPGAVEINGGAALYLSKTAAANVTLSSDRQLLLAGGTTGSSASIINVYGNGTVNKTLNFGGYIADYVGEVGSLEKQGGGTFNYSGTAYNTGSYAVTAGTFEVSGSGSINSGSGVTISTSAIAATPASFNYASTVGLSSTVTYGTGGGSFYYNSPAVYTGASSYTIGTGRTIGGGGNLGGTALAITSGGTLTPGTVQNGTATVGALTTGSVTLVAGGNYNFLLADMAGAAGTGYSTVNAASVDLTGLNSTVPFNINIEELAGNIPGLAANQATQPVGFTLFATGANGITALTQTQLNADFAIYTSPNNGATGFSPSPGIWSVEENANDSALVLEYTVPEPTTWAMLAGGLGLLVFIRRLRSRAV